MKGMIMSKVKVAAASELVIHKVDPTTGFFDDVTHEIGDVSNMSVPELAKRIKEYAKAKGIDPRMLAAEPCPT